MKNVLLIILAANLCLIQAQSATTDTSLFIQAVTKTILNPEDRTQDRVTAYFSEPIMGPNGSPFAWSMLRPSTVLAVYRPNAAGTGYDTLYNVLDSIASFTQAVNDSTYTFNMTNGVDLTPNDYINIKVAAGQVFNAQGNAPVADNRKVKVQTIAENSLSHRLIVVPDPSKPTCTRETSGIFILENKPRARDWIRTDGAGIVFTFKISPSNESVTGSIKVLDEAGTVVNSASSRDMLASLNYNPNNILSTYDYDIYWNGTKSGGDYVHPGVYTAELTCSTQGSAHPTTLTQSFYMEKPDYFPVKSNSCGTGYLVAFIPPISFRLKRPLLKFFRKTSGRAA
jgi:hypothetical protein